MKTLFTFPMPFVVSLLIMFCTLTYISETKLKPALAPRVEEPGCPPLIDSKGDLIAYRNSVVAN